MSEDSPVTQPKRRPVWAKLLELAFWVAVALVTAWVLIQNIETILPANNF